VVNTTPAAETQLVSGSTIKVNISGGPSIQTFEMPNLIGMTQAAATQALESANLTLGGVYPVTSDKAAGIVVGQSVDAGTQVQEHDKIFINVSAGPQATPTPIPTPTDTPPADTAPPDVSPADPNQVEPPPVTSDNPDNPNP